MLSRAYYSDYIKNFLGDIGDVILSQLVKNHRFDLEEQQKRAWIEQIRIFKENLKLFSFGYILFEYAIPRMGKRTDNVLLLKDIVFVIEFKVNENQYKNNDINQCFDYA